MKHKLEETEGDFLLILQVVRQFTAWGLRWELSWFPFV